jgi:hypothetical protein
MKTLQMIYLICTRPEFDIVVIGEEDERTRIEAIERLAVENESELWKYHADFDNKIIIIWQ